MQEWLNFSSKTALTSMIKAWMDRQHFIWLHGKEKWKLWNFSSNTTSKSTLKPKKGETALHEKGGIKIVHEFCPYGDLKSFLVKNRESVASQSETNTNRIGAYVGISEFVEENPPVTSLISPLTPIFPYTTTDLLKWPAQVASGFSSLASNDPSIVNRDLAARNILLCADKTVKIGDFGLSRTLNGSKYYIKISWAPDPEPWMAIESRQEGTKQKFSVKSDVWSFGVVLWELFSEGNNPRLFTVEQLENGMRLSKPEKALEKIYSLMKSCWRKNPEHRPTDDLEKALYKMYLDALKRDGKCSITVTGDEELVQV
ncbi:fibroblast growth factor receptor homolog 1-like [Sitodiplosis mosellana]|uniref:fibroblast growth factor receptor homolog 1-like n=1 Tax=Sitodiplosis mosellana TaxID=263140 RepID=UPI002443AFED|nr:fibroblast growth factor receptor homolog 1-like [Sitodiplosis mosellana]XP_055310178.1 fibroblast growth factor receptor homolog 1-like [Sitodiplosis mosellana]